MGVDIFKFLLDSGLGYHFYDLSKASTVHNKGITVEIRNETAHLVNQV